MVGQGFDDFIGYLSGNVDYHSHIDEEGYADWWKATKLENQPGYTTQLITQNADDFIKKYQKKPFFLYIAHEAPHYPFQGPNSKADRFEGSKPGIDFQIRGSEKNVAAIYKEMVEVLDENIGKTIKTLKDLNLDKNTIVIFISDNGNGNESYNGGLRGKKNTVWEGGHRVPAIVQWTGHIKPREASNEQVMSMDIFPTILDFTDIKKPENLDGESWKELLMNNKSMKCRNLYWESGKSLAVRNGKWKLVLLNVKAVPQLFDLELDITESNNVAVQFPEIVAKLKTDAVIWQADVNKEENTRV